ncbi:MULTISPECIES: glycosyltransferase family 4 protein [Emticicia]|uniref:glycosyltransferase family 4 protein n=1 Tax=Emticicia TaxID=312278 RepID=UPI0007D8AC29|nr:MULTISPECIES: glycosyltransferase family 4 protein [Emticicia]
MNILFVSHDANRAGAQLFLMNIMKYLKSKGINMQLLLLDGGVLENEFSKICPVHYWNDDAHISNGLKRTFRKFVKGNEQNQIELLLEKLQQSSFDYIYANTIATSHALPLIKKYLSAPLITHIHELEFSIQLYSNKSDREFLFKNSTKIISCSRAVAENLITVHGVDENKTSIIHSFVDNEKILHRLSEANKESIKIKYNLPESCHLIGGCGNAEWRKGIDIFIQVINQILNTSNEKYHFIWIGVKKEGEYYEQVSYDIAKMGIGDKITLIEQTPDAIELINCLDIFTIVSREDPFPLVMLEAALAQKTMIGFEKTGGCSEFIEEDAGIIVPYLNTIAMASSIIKLNNNQIYAKHLGEKAKEKVLNLYSFENSVLKIEQLLASI